MAWWNFRKKDMDPVITIPAPWVPVPKCVFCDGTEGDIEEKHRDPLISPLYYHNDCMLKVLESPKEFDSRLVEFAISIVKSIRAFANADRVHRDKTIKLAQDLYQDLSC